VSQDRCPDPGSAMRTLRCAGAGAPQRREREGQTDDHAAHANEPSFSRSEHTDSFDSTKLYPSYRGHDRHCKPQPARATV
jgi:hypothetical protein